MDRQLFMDMLHVAMDDYKAHDPDIEGIILITVKKDANDNAMAQLGTSIAPETVEYVLKLLMRQWDESHWVRLPQRNMIRKAV